MSVSYSMPDSAAGASLESVLCTEELDRRPSRPPDYELENRAWLTLAQALADSPRTILQTLADTILETFHCGSAGVSLLTDDEKRFHWPSIAGVWRQHIGGGTPRDFGPCGDVLDRNMPLMMTHVERRYTYFQPVTPLIEECLLVPFYVGQKAVGTIWAIVHDPAARKFDHEDLRILQRLGRFASSAYWAVVSLGRLGHQSDTLREMNEALLTSSVRQQELAGEAQQAEQQLRRSEELLTFLIDRSPSGFYIVDSDFRISHINADSQARAFRNVVPAIGRGLDEAMRILWPEPLATELINIFRHTLDTGEPYRSPGLVSPRNDLDSVETYEWQLDRITMPDGSYSVVCYYYDTTRLREAEQALREAKSASVWHKASHQCAFEWNIQTGINIWTPELESIYGL